jgi:hypothetical protein
VQAELDAAVQAVPEAAWRRRAHKAKAPKATPEEEAERTNAADLEAREAALKAEEEEVDARTDARLDARLERATADLEAARSTNKASKVAVLEGRLREIVAERTAITENRQAGRDAAKKAREVAFWGALSRAGGGSAGGTG